MTATPTKVTFRNLAHSEALEQEIHERVAWLSHFDQTIQTCSVTVEALHRHRQGGKPFHVRIEVSVPRRQPLVVSHEPSLHTPLKDLENTEHHKETDLDFAHRDAHLAVREAFDIARRKLLEANAAARSHRTSHLTFDTQY